MYKAVGSETSHAVRLGNGGTEVGELRMLRFSLGVKRKITKLEDQPRLEGLVIKQERRC